MFSGVFTFSFWGYVGVALCLTHLSIICVTLYLHRCQTHCALTIHPVVTHVMRFWLWLATGMVTKQWVSVHRKHHANCEKQGDPHSPQVTKMNIIYWVFWGGVMLYRQATRDPQTLARYGHGTPNDWVERHIYTPYSSLGILLLLVIYLCLFGWPGLFIWLVQMAWIPVFAAGMINGVGHYRGYRNFETPDASRNIVPWGILIGGEELHNNHHAYSASAKFSLRPWELDIGWCYICLLRCLGLASVKRLPPQLSMDPHKICPDMDTLRALLTDRFRIMNQYRRRVLLSVFKEEKARLGRGLPHLFTAQVCRLLWCDRSGLDENNTATLGHLFGQAQRLKTVYQFRLMLQDIWQINRRNRQDVLLALQHWCQQAETCGIEALQAFAQQLKTYSLKGVEGGS